MQYLLLNGVLQRVKYRKRQGFNTDMENAPHQAYPGRTTQKRSRGRDLKRSPPSESAVKKVNN